MEHFVFWDQNLPQKLTDGIFRLPNYPIYYYYCAHYNLISYYRKFIEIKGIVILGPKLVKIVTCINFWTTNYCN